MFSFYFCYYLKVDSARYGIIGAFITSRIIKEGEEFFINYGPAYDNVLGRSRSPNKRWYHELWKKFKEDHPNQIKLIENFETRNMKLLKRI